MNLKSITHLILILVLGAIGIYKLTIKTGCLELIDPVVALLAFLIMVIYTTIILIKNWRVANRTNIKFDWVPALAFLVIMVILTSAMLIEKSRYGGKVEFTLKMTQIEPEGHFWLSDYEDIVIQIFESGYYKFTYHHELERCVEKGEYVMNGDILQLNRNGEEVIQYRNYGTYQLDRIKMKAIPIDTLGKSKKLQKFQLENILHIVESNSVMNE